ncbi:hypothetical protein P256_01792 [Acinetobacter nectaris CIP 110549]|uniref:Lipoprotein n=1 Tax=Acinetobacter nectaris CIP 110549 TaxID=1392540 RepID=V2TKD7_9GAMM|nr:hypothetical protein [Acinetobacter nectaris]ESK38261.1 hypothetical protein P256_01792 [Acinetobacter nectaris CIP 110549]
MKYLGMVVLILGITGCTTTHNVSDPTHGKGGFIPHDTNRS